MSMFTKGTKNQNSQQLSPQLAQPNARLSTRAGALAQHIEDLESQLHDALERASANENRARIAEGQLSELKRRVTDLETQNDDARLHNARIMGILEANASILLQCMPKKESPKGVDKAIEEALAMPTAPESARDLG